MTGEYLFFQAEVVGTSDTDKDFMSFSPVRGPVSLLGRLVTHRGCFLAAVVGASLPSLIVASSCVDQRFLDDWECFLTAVVLG